MLLYVSFQRLAIVARYISPVSRVIGLLQDKRT